jgi:hypothetical protein
MASPFPAQERLRGWLYGNFPFGRRPYADSRVRLTEGRKVHSFVPGDALSSRAPTASGMAAHGTGWLHSSGDGRTGSEVTGETRSIGLMSRRCLARAWSKCLYLFRGLCCPLSRGCDVEAVREWAVQCDGVDTDLPAQASHSAKDHRTGQVGGTAPRHDSQAVSKGRCGDDSPLTRAPAACQSI